MQITVRSADVSKNKPRPLSPFMSAVMVLAGLELDCWPVCHQTSHGVCR